MGSRRGGRDDSPLAGLLRRSPRQEEKVGDERQPEDVEKAVGPDAATEPQTIRGQARTDVIRGGGVAPGSLRKKRGRPRGGRRSNPDYVQISARIHKDVRFSLERTLAERSEREGRYVEMAEVIESLMRFYIENGDPYQMLRDV